jgi:CBS domain-containing protein
MSESKTETVTVGDIMIRDVTTIPHDATLRDVAALLTAKNISGAPVVDDAGKMVGIISESDLLSEARRRAGLPHMAAFGVFVLHQETLERIYHNGATLLASEVMTKNVVTVTANLSISKAGDLMVKSKVNRVPVVDDDENLIGIVTREDVLKALFHVGEA